MAPRHVSLALVVVVLTACGGGGAGSGGDGGDPITPTSLSNPGAIVSGRILFAARGVADLAALPRLWVVNDDGTGLQAISSPGLYFMPDVEARPGGGFEVAWGWDDIAVYDTTAQSGFLIVGTALTRADFDGQASLVAFQGGGDGALGLNIWVAPTDASSPALKITTHGPGDNAEWPYFHPVTGRIAYFSTLGEERMVDADGQNDGVLGMARNFGCSTFKPDGTELFDPPTMTSYLLADGSVGSLDTLKVTTTMMSQLAALGYAEVPATSIPARDGDGSFAVSADWSRDGTQLVFDALVQDLNTSQFLGWAVFVYTIATDKLRLVFGPESVSMTANNNWNFSERTPKWIP